MNCGRTEVQSPDLNINSLISQTKARSQVTEQGYMAIYADQVVCYQSALCKVLGDLPIISVMFATTFTVVRGTGVP